MAELAPQLEPLLAGLFGALSKPDSDQNEYVMKTVMRVIVFVGKDVRRTCHPLNPAGGHQVRHSACSAPAQLPC